LENRVHANHNKHAADLLVYSYDGNSAKRIGNISVDSNRGYCINAYENGFIYEEGYKGLYLLKYYQWNGQEFIEEQIYSTYDLDWGNGESPAVTMESAFDQSKIRKSLPMVDVSDDSVFKKMN